MATATPPAGTIGHDQAAQILRLSPTELTRLVGAGTIPRVSPGVYHPGTIIGTYIEYQKSEIAARDKQIAARDKQIAELTEQLNRLQPKTQDEIAHHIDVSDRRLRELLAEWGISHKTTPFDEIRVRYIRKLREEAAGRKSSDPEALDPVQENALLKRSMRESVDLKNAKTRGEQAPIEALVNSISKMAEIAVSVLDQIDGDIAKAVPDLPDPARQVIMKCITDARNKIAARKLRGVVVSSVDPDDDIDLGDAEETGSDAATP